MSELLLPAGDIKAFYAAISGGCDAIYLGIKKYSARAYANNFTIEELKDLVSYAHLRNVKVYVTMNTILYDEELSEAYKMVDELAKIYVDAIIVQDLALLFYINNNYSSIKAHVSTQMGIDDYYGAKLLKDLGASRIVVARETPLKVLKDIKNNLDIELETFIHGALCVCYSGNCLMSSMIGERSGNRGRCAGCCRQIYSLIDLNTNKNINTGYLLSMKDLNTINYIKDLKFIDSLKVEGRMKDASYVYSVSKAYREALDNDSNLNNSLDYIFNRTYTKGFMFDEDSKNITNILRPNNYGFEIGKIVKVNKNTIWIKLHKQLSKGDQIRIENKDNELKEISISISKLFNEDFKEVEQVNKIAIISCNYKVSINSIVYKTKDIKYNKEIDEYLLKNKEYKRIAIDFIFYEKKKKNISLVCKYNNIKVSKTLPIKVEEAIKSSVSKDNIISLLNKINDTPYKVNNIILEVDDNIFIPLKSINELKRSVINELNNIRLKRDIIYKKPIQISTKNYNFNNIELSVEVSNIDQFNIAKEFNIKHIYFKNKILRNNATYLNKEEYSELLIGGYGSIEKYKDSNIDLISDYSFNVSNYMDVALLSNLGVKRITLSEELDKTHINNIVKNYYDNFNTYPNLELIIYGRQTLMHSKYCVLKRLNMCGLCKNNKFALKDKFETFPITFNDDCTMNVLNSKYLNLIDDLDKFKGINYYRLIFTDENEQEVRNIILSCINTLNNKSNEKTFNNLKHTRGHFVKKVL